MTRSASRAGIRLSMNSWTRPMVPAIIMMTLKSMELKIWSAGSIPLTMNTTAEHSAITGRYLLNANIST